MSTRDSIKVSSELGNLYLFLNGGDHITVRVSEEGECIKYRGNEFKGYCYLALVDGQWDFQRSENNPERESAYAFSVERSIPGNWQTVRPAPTHAQKIREVILSTVRAWVAANPEAMLEAKKAEVQRAIDRVEGEIETHEKALTALQIERIDLQQKLADLSKPVAKVLQLPVAPAPVAAPAKGQVTVDVLGHSLRGVKADIVPGKSIRIYGEYTNHCNGPQTFDRTFKVGDACERHSYNLVYTGNITQIGVKTVTIKDDTLSETSRLTLEGFISRNWDFDAEKIAKRNGEWMD